MEDLIEVIYETMERVNKDKKFAALQASMIKNAYDALIQEGFSPEQALTIVAHQGTGFKSS